VYFKCVRCDISYSVEIDVRLLQKSLLSHINPTAATTLHRSYIFIILLNIQRIENCFKWRACSDVSEESERN
jgi:hypothetical protein